MPYWKLYYHFVWGTRNGLPLIDSDLEPALYRAIVPKAHKLGGFVHAIGGIDEHVHFAVSIPLKLAPAKLCEHCLVASPDQTNSNVLNSSCWV